MARKKRAYVTSYEIYTIEDQVAVDYVGRYKSLDADFKTALGLAGVKRELEIPRTNITRSRKRDLAYQSYFTRKTGIWSQTGMLTRSPCSATIFDDGGPLLTLNGHAFDRYRRAELEPHSRSGPLRKHPA